MNVNQTAYVRKNDGTAGYQGEDNWREKRISIRELQAQYPGGSGTLYVKKEGDEDGYIPEHVVESNGELVWTLSDYDTEKTGIIEAQGIYTVNGERVGKTRIFRYVISRSLTGTAVVPADWQTWVNELLYAAEEVKKAADRAEAATVHQPTIGENGNWFVWDQNAGAYVDTEIEAEGREGFSPSATVSKSNETTTITITDKDGTTTAIIHDNENIVEVSKTQPTHSGNKLWIVDDENPVTYQVPTVEEMNAAVASIRNDLGLSNVNGRLCMTYQLEVVS